MKEVLEYTNYYEIVEDGKAIIRLIKNEDNSSYVALYCETNNIVPQECSTSVNLNSLPADHDWTILLKDL